MHDTTEPGIIHGENLEKTTLLIAWLRFNAPVQVQVRDNNDWVTMTELNRSNWAEWLVDLKFQRDKQDMIRGYAFRLTPL